VGINRDFGFRKFNCGSKKRMKYRFIVTFIVLISIQISFAQAPAFSFCGKTGDCTMTWDEFMKCKKQLIVTDKNISISSFIVTIQKAKKKDFIFLEFSEKGNTFSKATLDMIEELHKENKMGSKVQIDAVEVVQSGKAARKVPGMVIMLN